MTTAEVIYLSDVKRESAINALHSRLASSSDRTERRIAVARICFLEERRTLEQGAHIMQITPEEALNFAREVLKKCRASSNRYLVFIINGLPHITRDNSSITDRWERTGTPFLVGQYNKHCPVGDIAEDILHAIGVE